MQLCNQMKLSEPILAFAEIIGIHDRKGKWSFGKENLSGEYIVAQNKQILRELFSHMFLKILTDQRENTDLYGFQKNKYSIESKWDDL